MIWAEGAVAIPRLPSGKPNCKQCEGKVCYWEPHESGLRVTDLVQMDFTSVEGWVPFFMSRFYADQH